MERAPREDPADEVFAFGSRERAPFRGEEFVRALAVEPQPGAAAQVLAVELYGDGLVVHHTYDDPVDV